MKEQHLLFNYPLYESRIGVIKCLHGLEIREIHQSVKSVIQTRAYGGEIKVATKEGEGKIFIIQLPFV